VTSIRAGILRPIPRTDQFDPGGVVVVIDIVGAVVYGMSVVARTAARFFLNDDRTKQISSRARRGCSTRYEPLTPSAEV
jgi:hypothetical protein